MEGTRLTIEMVVAAVPFVYYFMGKVLRSSIFPAITVVKSVEVSLVQWKGTLL